MDFVEVCMIFQRSSVGASGEMRLYGEDAHQR